MQLTLSTLQEVLYIPQCQNSIFKTGCRRAFQAVLLFIISRLVGLAQVVAKRFPPTFPPDLFIISSIFHQAIKYHKKFLTCFIHVLFMLHSRITSKKLYQRNNKHSLAMYHQGFLPMKTVSSEFNQLYWDETRHNL